MSVAHAPPLSHLWASRELSVPRLRHLWVGLALLTTFIEPATAPVGITDVWWSLSSGAWMVSHHAVLTADVFTSAPQVASQVNAQWLAALAYFGAYQVGGLAAVTLLTALAGTLAFGFLLYACTLTSGRLRLSCAMTVLAYALASTNLTPRPQTLVYPFFTWFLLTLCRWTWRQDTRLLWTLPVVMVAWANMHGSFALGWALLACAALGSLAGGRPFRTVLPLLLTLAACVAAVCATPWGVGSLAYLVTIGANPIIREHATEWMPPQVSQGEGVLLFASFAAVSILALRSRTRLTACELLTLIFFAGMALAAVRSVVWWGFVMAPTAARLAASARPRGKTAPAGREVPIANWAIAFLIAATFVLSLPWLKGANPFLPTARQSLAAAALPITAVDYLASHPEQTEQGNLFDDELWGGYIGWKLWPRTQPFLDGRFEIHPPEVWEEYLRVVLPSFDWQRLLDREQVSTLLLSQEREAGLIDAARASSQWQIAYEDQTAVVFARRSAVSPAGS